MRDQRKFGGRGLLFRFIDFVVAALVLSSRGTVTVSVVSRYHQEAVKLTPRSTDAVSIYPAKAHSR